MLGTFFRAFSRSIGARHPGSRDTGKGNVAPLLLVVRSRPMRRVLLSLLAMSVCALWPQTSAKRSYPIQLGPRLNVSTTAELDRRLSAPFPDGVAHPEAVHSCAEWLAKGGAIPPDAAGPDVPALKSAKAQCLIISELRGAAASRVSHVADLKWDEHVFPLLPPQLAVNVSQDAVNAADKAAGRGRGWTDVDRTAAATGLGPDEIIVKGDGFTERLILWGRGDFDHDGAEDLLVQTLDTLTEGSYRNTRLFVLTRKKANAKLSVAKQVQ